ncbi:MAG: YciI family protein [Pseudomonadota bacterium]
MFVIQLHYKVAIETVDQYLIEHRNFLDEGYQKNYFIASGPKNPRTGGIILSQLKDRTQIEKILSEDPFSIHGVADYDIMEFTPVKFHADFVSFV